MTDDTISTWASTFECTSLFLTALSKTFGLPVLVEQAVATDRHFHHTSCQILWLLLKTHSFRSSIQLGLLFALLCKGH